MKNRELFLRDPLAHKLENDGVASVTEATTANELQTLRYEVEHFVCEGQYEDGIVRVLKSYLDHLGSTAQPAAWVSGFYGSGKSHLLKMLRHLWVDTAFTSDGSTARGLAHLTSDVTDLLKELSTVGKRYGGLHAASGTMPSGGNLSVRLIVLGIVLRSKGFPEVLPAAKFCLWLRKNGLFDQLKAAVESQGREFASELYDLYASPVLAKALLAVHSDFAASLTEVGTLLEAQFPDATDITTAEFIRLIREILMVDGQIPCTVIVLDEIQLFIGSSDDRSTGIQEVAEALCKQLDSRVLLIGAGQTALASGTPLLQRLQARFTIPVELSDTDVETVTRRVVLAKRKDKDKAIRECLDSNSGEINRQLQGTAIAVRADDRTWEVEDYPLLPVRRRFWEHVMRAVDVAGTTSQLRSQLRIVHDAAAEIAEKPLGTVVPADYFFDQQQATLLRTGALLRDHDETIRKLDDGTPDGRLARRVCALVYLIRKLPREAAADIKVRATAEALADLLVSDLTKDGPTLRRDVPRVLERLVADGKLIKLDGDEYSLQTRESAEWDREFRNRQTRLNGDLTAQGTKRSELLKAACLSAIGSVRLTHGKSKEPRTLVLHFGPTAPEHDGSKIPIWIRDGWGEAETTVVSEARAAGADSPVIFVWLKNANASDLATAIVDCEAARATLDFKGVPSTPAAREAADAMAARLRDAERRRNEIVQAVANAGKVFQGGGTERFELTFAEKIKSAAEAALDRMFPNFRDADHDRWDSVITRAKSGDEAALEAVGHKDKPERHPVCAAVLAKVGSGMRGREIRGAFEGNPYGWPRDAVDAALITLHTTGHLRAMHNGTALGPKQLDQAKIPVTEFRAESAPLQVADKLKLRRLFQGAGIHCNSGEEIAAAPQFIARLTEVAQRAGGDEPLPARPSTAHLDVLRGLAGNDQLSAILLQHDELAKQLKDWTEAGDLATKRKSEWESLCRLLHHGKLIPEVEDLQRQADAIRDERRLLDATDPVPALAKGSGALLRAAVTAAHTECKDVFAREMANLAGSENWSKLTPEQQQQILRDTGISPISELSIGDESALLRTLDETPLSTWRTRAQALPTQFAGAALAAARLLEPKIQQVHLSSRTLKTPEDLKAWLAATEADLTERLKKGPVVII